ncbi:MAG: hypothetical protein U0103_13095 [Candidatus Obscuribacterales bacterium]|nr:hypothetical protein [Cyanobacteria bacterium SZAS LIN-5]RTL35613.1 MAG: hypothetical protein EKK48_28380 [Candidatus Melainabacteria bacterium]
MSTLDASAEATRIANLDRQTGKGAEAASATLAADYNNYLQEHGNDTQAAQKWLKDTTAELAKAGVLPDIAIGVLSNEKDNLSSDGDKITQHDIIHDNFLLSGSTGAQQSFDAVFTDMLANNTNGITDQVNEALGSKNGTYTEGQFNDFAENQAEAAQKLDAQNASRKTDAGLFEVVPGTNMTVLQYLDIAARGGDGDGKIGRSDLDAALANPVLSETARASIEALKQQLHDEDWNTRSITDILKQDGVAVDGSPKDGAGFYDKSVTAYKQANSDYQAIQEMPEAPAEQPEATSAPASTVTVKRS